jgi:hypothetical protein
MGVVVGVGVDADADTDADADMDVNVGAPDGMLVTLVGAARAVGAVLVLALRGEETMADERVTIAPGVVRIELVGGGELVEVPIRMLLVVVVVGSSKHMRHPLAV